MNSAIFIDQFKTLRMNSTEIKTIFEQGDQFLDLAQEEMNRPAEDVVSYMVCRSVRASISHYLKGFLLENKVAFSEDEALDVLLEKSQTIDSNFKNIDLSPLKFTKDYEYSAEIDQMGACINIANLTRGLIQNRFIK